MKCGTGVWVRSIRAVRTGSGSDVDAVALAGTYLLQAQPAPLLQVLFLAMHASPHGLPVSQCMQHEELVVPLDESEHPENAMSTMNVAIARRIMTGALMLV